MKPVVSTKHQQLYHWRIGEEYAPHSMTASPVVSITIRKWQGIEQKLIEGSSLPGCNAMSKGIQLVFLAA